MSETYDLVDGRCFVSFDALEEFRKCLSSKFPSLKYKIEVISKRSGRKQRSDYLVKLMITDPATGGQSICFVYLFATEQGGRPNDVKDENRIQWAPHNSWKPDLSNFTPASIFSIEANKTDGDLTNKECYIFGIYKRSPDDENIIFSAIYPKQVADHETYGTTSRSFQYKVTDIQESYRCGVARTIARNRESGIVVVHFKPEYLFWYMLNRDQLHIASIEEFSDMAKRASKEDKVVVRSSPDSLPRNKIYYGAPGTGKSHKLNQDISNVACADDVMRVTFYPSYSFQQFVGAYRPNPIYRRANESVELFAADRKTRLSTPLDKEPLIDYSFVPGPFLQQYINAKNNPDRNFFLVIEEINRANAAAVFGDIFQLLDRSESGESTYHIEFSADIRNFLKSEGLTDCSGRLPNNFFIWATMNSSDQGVMPLDAAFKRRWSFEYIGIDQEEDIIADWVIAFQGERLSWNSFRKQVNSKLKNIPAVSEDRLLGPFFLTKSELQEDSTIKNKLLLYLRDDLVRHNPQSLFSHSSFSDISKAYDAKQPVFADFVIDPLRLSSTSESDKNGSGHEGGEAYDMKPTKSSITSDYTIMTDSEPTDES